MAKAPKGFFTTVVGQAQVDYVVTVDSDSKMIWISAFAEIPRTPVP